MLPPLQHLLELEELHRDHLHRYHCQLRRQNHGLLIDLRLYFHRLLMGTSICGFRRRNRFSSRYLCIQVTWCLLSWNELGRLWSDPFSITGNMEFPFHRTLFLALPSIFFLQVSSLEFSQYLHQRSFYDKSSSFHPANKDGQRFYLSFFLQAQTLIIQNFLPQPFPFWRPILF